MNVIYFPNLRSAGSKPVSTGTMVTDAAAVQHSCLDTFIRNDNANPIFTSVAGQDIKDGILHDASSANIDGTYQALGGSGVIPANTKKIFISSNLGAPISLGIGGTAGTIVKTVVLVPGQGGTALDYIYTAGQKIWIKTLDGSTLNSSYIAVNFTG